MCRPKLNCWEFKNCGREKGGLLADTLGVCPVALTMKHDGVHGGIAAGRVCWQVRNSSRCKINLIDSEASACHECAFYLRVQHEEAGKTVHQFASAIDAPAGETPSTEPVSS